MNCLIGYTGFVGGNLASQRNYDVLINSKNFHSMEGKTYDYVVCAGVPAVKWKANKEPEADLAHINELVDVLKTVKAKRFTLISTIDVYSVNKDVDEDCDCHNPAHHAYFVSKSTTAPQEYFAVDVITSIPDVSIDSYSDDEAKYNLSGQRVDDSYRSIIITKGRKILVK